ncbi:MAG: flagellar biosynthesis regulator FlaF [Alphaproteobacteria bacterium]
MPAPRNNPYQQAQKLGSNPSETESRALLEAARRLAAVQRQDVPLEEYRAALRLNWRLWTLFQTDIAEPENPLPLPLKNNMLSLAAFVDRQTVAALARVTPNRLQVLIDINRQIAAGLNEGRAHAAAQAKAGSPAETAYAGGAPAQGSGPAPSINRFVA